MIRKIAQYAVNRPATIIVLMVALTLIGAMSVAQMPTDLLPEIELPYAAVITSHGAGLTPRKLKSI